MPAGGPNGGALPTATPIQYMGQQGAPVVMQGGRVVHMGGMPMHAFGGAPGARAYVHPGMQQHPGMQHPGMHPGMHSPHGHGGVNFYGPQAGGIHEVIVMEMSEQERRLLPVYHLGKLVRIFAIIDIVWVVLLGLQNPLWFLLLVIPLSGYQATIKYHTGLARVYILFQLLQVLRACYSFSLATTTNVQILFGVIHIIISFYIVRLIVTFIQVLNTLDSSDLTLLRSPANTLGQHRQGVFF